MASSARPEHYPQWFVSVTSVAIVSHSDWHEWLLRYPSPRHGVEKSTCYLLEISIASSSPPSLGWQHSAKTTLTVRPSCLRMTSHSGLRALKLALGMLRPCSQE